MLKGSRDAFLTLAAIRLVAVLIGAALVFSFPMPAAEAFFYLLGSIIVFYLYYFFMLNAYRVGDFGQVYPISRSIAPILVAALGAVLAGEDLTVAVVRETSVIFAALIGAFVLREGFQWRRISAACVVAMGVATLVLLQGQSDLRRTLNPAMPNGGKQWGHLSTSPFLAISTTAKPLPR
jgi:drug/metabolite transporter (DMT)-like permease